MNKRFGFTLIELMISMSASSVLLALAVGLVHRSMMAYSIANDRADHQRTLVRLSDQFRSDIHQAKSIEQETPEKLRINFSIGSPAIFRIDGNRCRREQSLDNERQRIETYEFSTGTQIEFDAIVDPDRATLTIKRATLNGIEPLVDAHAMAVVGRTAALQESKEQNP